VVVVLGGPTQPLAPHAVEQIRSYVEGGGAAFLLIDRIQINPQMPMSMSVSSGLESIVGEWGVEVGEGIVYDLQSAEQISMGRQGMFQLVQSYPLWPVTFRGDDHATTRDLANLTAGWASPLTFSEGSGAIALWQTTEAGGIQPTGSPITPDIPLPEDPAQLGVRTIGAAMDLAASSAEGSSTDPTGRVIIMGDANFLEDEFTRANPQNLAFAANAVDWLAQDEVLIGIRSKDRRPPPLVFTSDFGRAALKWGNLVGIPLLFVAIGAGRVLGRRRRAERRWGEVAS